MRTQGSSTIPAEQAPSTIPFDYVVCQVCSIHVRKSMVGKGGHLAVKHDGMSVQEYRAAYPDAILYSPRRIALETKRRQQRPELVRARSKRWRDKNPEKANLNARNWEAANPDKVKVHKRRAAQNYADRRRMLWAARTPEQIEDDRRKAREAYARRYPARSPEKVQKDHERNLAKYQARQAKLAAAEGIIAKHAPDPRITLAVCLEIQGLTKYEMKDQVYADLSYPDKTKQREARKARTSELFRRKPKEFERERKRLTFISQAEQLAVAEQARSQITPKG